jgi:hypothetical protein
MPLCGPARDAFGLPANRLPTIYSSACASTLVSQNNFELIE